MEFPAEVDSLLLRRFREQHLVCVAVKVQWKVLMSVGVVGAFACPEAITAQAVSYRPTLRLWAVPVLAAKLSNQGEMYGLSPFSFRITQSFSPAYVRPLSAKDGSEMRL